MKLSTKGRYGLRAILDLAINSKEHHVTLYSIAERQNISTNYLEQIFAILKKSGLVKSIKGAQGGYILADSPSNIKIGYILRKLEGNLNIVEDENIIDLDKNVFQSCIKRNVWDKLNSSIDNIVDSINLQDLVNDCIVDDTRMYFI
jgi:Rrf2 family cysteine metabolism transcriptional repressor